MSSSSTPPLGDANPILLRLPTPSRFNHRRRPLATTPDQSYALVSLAPSFVSSSLPAPASLIIDALFLPPSTPIARESPDAKPKAFPEKRRGGRAEHRAPLREAGPTRAVSSGAVVQPDATRS
ncbi:hypothetical protein WOLCODRAFT_148690 [Wolfiporia cocos MD-104 SS10]|uniref:Uncharacterized protein n=1 Tax=Wolfiporia cocos (strain MD-104) TaxID=742152 RepID=A0A2H3JM61_WOLCO|nr:hypothetical protein WOLCODRAFT_148690 [Wolfiporia cocos MD-104 SS10]